MLAASNDGTVKRGRGAPRAVPSYTAARQAAERIKDRREQHAADGVEQLPDTQHLLELLTVLSRVPCIGEAVHPAEARRAEEAEFTDAAVIFRYLAHQLLVVELSRINAAQEAGVTWAAVARGLGYKTRRGAEGRAASVEAAVRAVQEARERAANALDPVVPGPRKTRELRHARRTAVSDDGWRVRNEHRIRAAATALLDRRDRWPRGEDTDEWLDDLAEQLNKRALSARDRAVLTMTFCAAVRDVVDAAHDAPLGRQDRHILDAAMQLVRESP